MPVRCSYFIPSLPRVLSESWDLEEGGGSWLGRAESVVSACPRAQAVQSGTSIPGADGRRFSLGYLEACLSNLHHSIQAELAACNLVGPSLSASCGISRLVQN